MRRRYVEPVRLAEEIDSATKARNVTIYKNEVYKQIDLHTHKHVDAHEEMGLRTANAVSSDTTEDVDGAVVADLVAFRDAELRRTFQFALADTAVESATDEIPLADRTIHYNFVVSDAFNDNTLKPLALYIHRYLVWGALYDWYSQLGMPQAERYGAQLRSVEAAISSILHGPSIVKRPMQPFGPAQPMI